MCSKHNGFHLESEIPFGECSSQQSKLFVKVRTQKILTPEQIAKKEEIKQEMEDKLHDIEARCVNKRDGWARFKGGWRQYPLEFLRQKYLTAKKRRDEIRMIVLKHYSPGKVCCKKCGIDDLDVLQLDHIDGNGFFDMYGIAPTTHGAGGMPYYKYLIETGFQHLLQVLCANCNWKKRVENGETN